MSAGKTVKATAAEGRRVTSCRPRHQHAGTLHRVLKRTAGKAGKNHRPRLDRQETQLLLVSSNKKKNRKINLPRFYILFFFSPQVFAGHKDGPIMVSLYMPLSDVKQKSKSEVSGLPTADTTIIIFTTTSPHHCSVAAAADTPTRATSFPASAKFTLCKQRLHLGPSPGPCRGRAVLLLSPSGQSGDGLINMERKGETDGGREGGGGGRRDGKHMWETTQKMALCPGRRKAAAETCSSQSSEKKNRMKCKSSISSASKKKKKT